MSEPSGYRFTKTHEWVRSESEQEALIGITEHAQGQLGDVIFLELPQVGSRVEQGARFGAVESVKAASDLYSPVSGEVLEVNQAVGTSPELVNQEAQGRGWLIRVRLEGDLPAELMDASAYDSYAQSDSH